MVRFAPRATDIKSVSGVPHSGGMRPRRVGILGGTFDPIHKGHLRLAKAAYEQLKLDFVYFVPSYQTPLKTHEPHISLYHRVRLVRLAIQTLPFAKISLVEVRKRGLSYTVDTVRYFKQRLWAGTRFYFLTGSDTIRTLRKWKDPNTLMKWVSFAVAIRPGGRLGKTPKCFIKLTMTPCRFSSSQIRREILSRRSTSLYLPPSVNRYIQKHHLYGA